MVLAELIADLLPEGVLNIVNGYGVEAGKPLAQNPRIAKIAFTGETTTGQLIMSYASENLIPVTLEWAARAPTSSFPTWLPRTTIISTRRSRGSPCSRSTRRGLHMPQPRAGPRIHL